MSSCHFALLRLSQRGFGIFRYRRHKAPTRCQALLPPPRGAALPRRTGKAKGALVPPACVRLLEIESSDLHLREHAGHDSLLRLIFFHGVMRTNFTLQLSLLFYEHTLPIIVSPMIKTIFIIILIWPCWQGRDIRTSWRFADEMPPYMPPRGRT